MRRAAFAAAALLAAATASAVPFEVVRPAMTTGQPRLLLAPRSGPTATLVVSFDAGAVADGDMLGITRTAQYALVFANRRLDAERFLLDVFAAAGHFEIETGQREARFVLTVDRRDFADLAARLLNGLLAPSLDAARFDSARSRARRDARGSGGQDYVWLVTSMAIDDGRYRNEPYGEEDAIAAFLDDDISRHAAARLLPAAATVAFAGSFDRDAAVRLARRFRGGKPPAVDRPVVSLPHSSRKLASQETHLLAFPLTVASPEDAAATLLLAELLDADVWRRFRESGMSYTYAVEGVRSPWLDLLLIVIPAHNPGGASVEPMLRDAIALVRSGAFDDAAFERARSASAAAFTRLDQEPEALARALAADGVRFQGAGIAAALERLDRAAFIATASSWLDPSHRLYAYFGPTP